MAAGAVSAALPFSNNAEITPTDCLSKTEKVVVVVMLVLALVLVWSWSWLWPWSWLCVWPCGLANVAADGGICDIAAADSSVLVLWRLPSALVVS